MRLPLNLELSKVIRRVLSSLMVVCVLALTACSPEVGSQKWCDNMKKKPEKDWTMAEAKDFAKHCLFK